MQLGYPASYQLEVAKIKKFEQFYRILLCKYKICLSCVYRIFGVLTPKIYFDSKNSNKLMAQILDIAQQKCKREETIENYRFLQGQFKIYYEEYIKKQQEDQQFCWLCSGILQTKYLNQSAAQVISKVKQECFDHKQKYKLMTKIHNIFAMKQQVFCNLVLAQLQKQQLIKTAEIEAIRKEIVIPLFEKTGLDLKTVFKWKLSAVINQQPTQVFTLTSTINQDEQTAIVDIEIQHFSKQTQQIITNLIGPTLGFQKIKQKKGRIQLKDTDYQATWTIGLINRLTQITGEQWMQMLARSNVDCLKQIQLSSNEYISMKTQVQSLNLYFSGKYCKYSRYLSQTPWVVNKERLTQSSLQQEVQDKILKFFYPPSIPVQKIDIKFHAGGRQDIDVRMLKGGRPFVIELVNPRKNLDDITIQQILKSIEKDCPQQYKNLPLIKQIQQEQKQSIKCMLLQLYINSCTELAKVYNLTKSNQSFISIQLKQAESEKIKHYVCFIKSEQQIVAEDKQKLQSCYNLAVVQKTPIRVLHRRTLMYRNKTVFKMIFHPATKYSGILQIWASAGTYIKQFVHGDLNRTLPNVGTILNKTVDILQLDVGSLKQGQWVQGDHGFMKLDQLAWQKQVIDKIL